LDPDQVKRHLSPRTRALLPIHLFGQASALDELTQIASKSDILVVEDVAQAIDATFSGQKLGSFGAVGCFSFYPTKNLGAAGDGGLCVTSDEKIARRLRMLRVHGIERRYYHDIHGFNSRLDELQAAILQVKLRHLAAWNLRRSEIAKRYDEGLRALPV